MVRLQASLAAAATAEEDARLQEALQQLPRQLFGSYSWLDAESSLRIMSTLPETPVKASQTHRPFTP